MALTAASASRWLGKQTLVDSLNARNSVRAWPVPLSSSKRVSRCRPERERARGRSHSRVSGMALTAASASRWLGKQTVTLVHRRFLSSSSKILADEARAVENAYIRKMEQEKLEKLALLEKEDLKHLTGKGPNPEEPDMRVTPSPFPPGRVSIVDLMDCVERGDYGFVELKYAMRVIQKKCGTDRHIIEMELSTENRAMYGAYEFQLDYIRDVGKNATLHAELKRAREENKVANDKLAVLHKSISAKEQKSFWQRVKPVVLWIIREAAEMVVRNPTGLSSHASITSIGARRK